MQKIRKQSTGDKIFLQYVIYIIEQLIEYGHAPSYATVESMRKWYNEIPYDATTMDFLIIKTNLFTSTLSSRCAYSTHYDFLNALTNRMADYLSSYEIRKNPKIDDHSANCLTYRAARDDAKRKLKDALFHNCRYIQLLFAKQHAARKARSIWPKVAISAKKQNAKLQACKDYELAKQIRNEFAAAQNIARKR